VSATLGIRAFGTTVTLDITAMHSMAAAESSLAQFLAVLLTKTAWIVRSLNDTLSSLGQ